MEVLQQHLVLGRELFQVPAVVDGNHVVLGSESVVKVGGAHVAKGLVMPVAFAVGADAHQLRVFAVRVPGVLDALAENARIAEQVLKTNSTAEPGIVEEHVQVAIAYRVSLFVPGVDAVGACGVDVGVAAAFPVFCTQFTEGIGLGGGEDGKLDSCLDEFHHCRQVDSRFGQPHGLGHASEMELEVFDAPENLRALVLLAGERHDDVVIDLGDGVAVTVQTFGAPLVGFLDSLVSVGGMGPDPTHEGGAHVEAHEVVVVDDILDAPL